MTKLKDAGFTALWAGGCVRDLLLNHRPKDYDVATDARPNQVRELFGKRRTLAVGESFGVIIVLGPKDAGQVEVATFRSDGQYLDGRRPESVQFSSPEEDAQRRDFTINGMFYDPVEKQVLDFVGGREDLEAGVIRAIRDPRERMTEDKLRMLRAVRFAATFDYVLESGTAAAVREMAAEIKVVSAERIAQELRRMLAHPNRHRAIELSRDVRILEEILPETTACTESDEAWSVLIHRLEHLAHAGFPVALACVFSTIAEARGVDRFEMAEELRTAGRRLRLSNDEVVRAAWLVRHANALDEPECLSLAELKRTLAASYVDDLLQLLKARHGAGESTIEAVEFCTKYLEETPVDELNPEPLITGSDLIAAGMTPGPAFKEVLAKIRDAQLNGEITTHEEALALARKSRSA